MPRLRLALAQTNPLVGDIPGNSDQIVDAARRAHEAGADLLAVGEMAITGSPIEDLAAQPSFLRAAHAGVAALGARLDAEGLGDLPVIVGHPAGPFEPRLLETSNAPSTTRRTTRGSTSTASSFRVTSCSCFAFRGWMSPSSSARTSGETVVRSA